MADQTAIPVVNATWNPVTGCSPCSPGCRRCYARRFAKRLAGRHGYPSESPFAPTFHPGRLDQPARWRKPRSIFVCSMGDLFHEDLNNETIDIVLQTMESVPRHNYLVLTKRPERMAKHLATMAAAAPRRFEALKRCLWLGVSVENQQAAEERLTLLVSSWPGLCVVCCEPLLGAVDLKPWLVHLHWVIAGGETGPGGQQADHEHVRQLCEQCADSGTPLYFKQWGGRNNKKLGNHVDGRTWEQMPQPQRHETMHQGDQP